MRTTSLISSPTFCSDTSLSSTQEMEILPHLHYVFGSSYCGTRGCSGTKQNTGNGNWPTPSLTRVLRGFLELTGYYWRSAKDYDKITKPLTDLLKKGAFHWSDDADKASQCSIQDNPASNPSSTRFPKAICRWVRCIWGRFRPCTYARRVPHCSLQPRTIKYSTKQIRLREGTNALVLNDKKWRSYLLDHKFVRIDQRSLKYLLEQQVSTIEQQHWLAKLLPFTLKITYKSRRDNKAADALSRGVDC